MQIVINIPEETKQTFDNADDINFSYYDYNSVIGKAIRNGIPLPKGHGRLIDAGEYIDVLNNAQIEGLDTYKGLGRAKELLIDAPTIIKADVAESEDKE